MSNRFLLSNSQNQNISTESTQLQIRDKLLEGTIDVSGNVSISSLIITDISMNLQTTDVNVNVQNIVDTSTNITNIVDTSTNITNVVDTSTNITNVVDTSTNITNVVEISSNTLNLESTQSAINSKIPNLGSSTSSGSVPVTQNLDSAWRVNNETILNVPIAVGVGNTTSGTQRVILVSDQPTVNVTINNPVINTQNYKYNKTHESSNVQSTNSNSNYLITPFNDILGITSSECWFSNLNPGVQLNMSIVSSDGNDNDGGGSGLGAHEVTIFYYTSHEISSLKSIVVTMIGSTRFQFATDFFRLKSAVVTKAGIALSNVGNIYIFESNALGSPGIPTDRILSLIPGGYSINKFSYWFIPRDSNYQYIHFDYLNLGVSSDNAADDQINILMRYTNVTQDYPVLKLGQNHFYQADANILSKVDLSNLVVPMTNINAGIDLMYIYTHPTASDFDVIMSVGYHYSNSPH